MKKILTLTILFAALLVAAVSCKKDDPKPAPSKDDPKNPPTQQKVEITEVKLNETTLSLVVDDTETLTATIAPTNATDKKVTWSSSDKTIATVDNNGKVTAVAVGEATITAKAGNKTASCKVTVSAKVIEVTSVTLDKATLELEVDATETLIATVAPEDATNKEVTWESSDTDIAIVDNNGKVTAVAEGEATITAKAGDKTASCKVTVSAKVIEVTSVTLNKTTLTLVVDATETLIATIAPADATDKKVTWSSSNTSIATVDNNGKVTAIAEGEATITATSSNGKNATCIVKVTNLIPVTGVVIESVNNHIALGLDNMTMLATVFPSNATNKNITWSVDDQSVVQLSSMTNSSCVMTGLKEGYTILKATTQDGNKVDECLISVSDIKVSLFKSDLKIPTEQISAGSFQMGSPDSDTEAYDDEKPQHKVTLTKAFYMSKFETTNYQFAEFLNARNVGSDGKLNGNKLIEAYAAWGVQYNTTTGKWQAAAGKAHYPVVYVSWYGANEFATWVGGRLPTEAEWEYACRAGTITPYYWGNSSNDIDSYAWYYDNTDLNLYIVGQKKPNNWGLYDMSGNVYEWCSDWFDSAYYTAIAQTNPTGPTSGSRRVRRGGSWYSGPESCRSACRDYLIPTSCQNITGFRVVFD